MSAPAHPCQYSGPVLDAMARSLRREAKRLSMGRKQLLVLDPCAGTGLRVMNHPMFDEHAWLGIELEASFIAPEAWWVAPGDMTDVSLPDHVIDVYCTSYVFPNRMTDSFIQAEGNEWEYITYSHKARANRNDRTYRLAPTNAGALRWGEPYRELHSRAIAEGIRVLRHGGLFVVEMKNHMVKGEIIPVTEWFVEEFKRQGCKIERKARVGVPGNRKGANREQREEYSTLIHARAPR